MWNYLESVLHVTMKILTSHMSKKTDIYNCGHRREDPHILRCIASEKKTGERFKRRVATGNQRQFCFAEVSCSYASASYFFSQVKIIPTGVWQLEVMLRNQCPNSIPRLSDSTLQVYSRV